MIVHAYCPSFLNPADHIYALWSAYTLAIIFRMFLMLQKRQKYNLDILLFPV